MTHIQKCSACGCTEADCSKCVDRTGGPCFWVKHDLCSACHELAGAALPSQYIRKKGGPSSHGHTWMRGFYAGLSGKKCNPPYRSTTRRGRGYARVWRCGFDSAAEFIKKEKSKS